MISCLDTEVWYGRPDRQEKWFESKEKNGERVPGTQWENGRRRTVLYSFYAKPMANPLTMLRRSAVPEGTKVATVSQEILRRWRNTSLGVGRKKVEQVTKEYMDNLAAMGYPWEWRNKVLQKALTGYMRLLARVESGGVTRNRKGSQTRVKRRYNKLVGKSDWFRQEEEKDDHLELGDRVWPRVRQPEEDKGPQVRVESVFFVPHTPEGQLRKQFMEVERRMQSKRGKIKYVESMGLTIGQKLSRKDPWGNHCGRTKCMPCMEKPGRCTREGVIYVMTCRKCEEAGDKVQYVGESARTAFDRGSEHLEALRKGNQESPLVEHNKEAHKGEPSMFKMEVVAYPRSNLQRQALEASMIQSKSAGTKLLNRRGEWGQNLPPQLTFEGLRQKQNQGGRTGNSCQGMVWSKGDVR